MKNKWLSMFLIAAMLVTGLAPALPAAKASAATDRTDMLLWYKFDNESKYGAIVPDASGNGHNGTLVSGAVLSDDHGGSVVLDGNNSAVRMPNNLLAGLDEITITMSVLADPGLARPAWFFKFSSHDDGGTNGSKYLGLLEDGSSRFRASITNNRWTAEQSVTKTGAYAKGVWKNIAFTISGNTATLYEDGVQIAQNANMTISPRDLDNTVSNYIGQRAYPGDRNLKGKVSDFRIYTKALSLQEIQDAAAEQDEGIVADDKAGLVLNNTNAATQNFALPAAGAQGSDISWTSSNPAVVSNDGTITRQPDSNARAVLTATINKGAFSDTKAFEVTVLGTGDAEAVGLDAEALALGRSVISENAITLATLGDNGSSISWQTSNAAVIETDGTVHRPAGSQNVKVTLTATIEKGGAATSKSFDLTVQAETPVLAHWKFSQDQVISGSLENGDLRIADLSGMGNELVLHTTGDGLHDTASDMLRWSDDGKSLVFDNYRGAAVGKYLSTVSDAPINNERFADGYTIEVMFKMPSNFTPDKHRWAGILSRAGAASEIGKNGGEREFLSTLAVSNLQELQWTSHPLNLNYNPTAWSLSLSSSKNWYHTAIVNDGSHTKLFVNGATDFRNPAETINGIALVPGKGWDIGAAESNGDKYKLFAGSIQEIRITGKALDEADWFAEEYDTEGLIDGNNDDMPLVTNDDTYTVAFIPDTQNTVRYMPEIFHAQMQWLADHYENNRIEMTAGLGDIVDQSWVGDQWNAADFGYRKLDEAGTPYLVARGNHDWPPADGWNRYRELFGDNRFAGRDYWHGGSPSGYSSYVIFEGGSYKYMILSIDMRDFNQDLAWAQNVLASNKDLPTIIVSHEILIIQGDGVSLDYNGNGQSLFNNLVRDNNQVFMTIGGHNHGTGYRIVKNGQGRDVIEMLADYQSYYHGGNGWLRLMEMDEAGQKLNFRTFSPWAKAMPENERTYHDLYNLIGESENFSLNWNFDERFGFYEKQGSIQGEVTDGTAPLFGAKVTVYAGGSEYSAMTGEDGSYIINGIPEGNGYILKAGKAGYQDAEQAGIAVLSNKTAAAQQLSLVPQSSIFHTVTFDINGGDADSQPAERRVIDGGNVAVLPHKPTKKGYVLKEWNTQPDGSGTVFAAETAVTQDITLYAQWTDLLLWYAFDFEPTGGNVVPDASGNGNDGLLTNGASLTDEHGGSVQLDGIDGSVKMPDGILEGVDELTVNMSVNVDPTVVNPSWLFKFASDDFAVQGSKYMGLLNGDWQGRFRAAITANWHTAEQSVSKNTEITKGVWKNITYTLAGNTATLYEDGVVVGQTTNISLKPSDMEATVANYIGRRAYSGDKNLKGSVSDFRIYTRALSEGEIAALSAEQLKERGSIGGTVTDGTQPVAGATVTMTVEGQSYEAVTDAHGAYVLRGVPAGDGYEVAAAKKGYIDGVASPVSVLPNQLTADADIVLIPIPVYQIAFNSNGGDTEASPSFIPVLSGETVESLPLAPTRAGYFFAGWNAEADGSGTSFTEATIVYADEIVYAQWQAKPADMLTGHIGGTVTDGIYPIQGAVIEVTVGESTYRATTMADGGYLLADVPAGGPYTVYAAKPGYADKSIEEIYVSVDQWTSNIDFLLDVLRTTYIVTFDENRSPSGADTFIIEVESNETVKPWPAPPARSGFAFIGWNTRPDGTGTAFNAQTPVTGNVTVYAIWRAANTGNTGSTVVAAPTVPNYVKSESIVPNGDNVTVDLSSGITLLSNEQMKEIVASNKDKAVVLKGNGYTVSFAAGSMLPVTLTEDFDLGISIDSPAHEDKIRKLTNGKLSAVVSYAYGEENVGDSYVGIKAGEASKGKPLHYYYYNEAANKLEYVQSTIVDSKGFGHILHKQGGVYVLAEELLDQSNGNGALIGLPGFQQSISVLTVPYFIKDGKEQIVSFSAIRNEMIHYIGDGAIGYSFKNNAKVFEDTTGHWSESSVAFVAARELFSGTSEGAFSPDQAMTRGMLVTVLGRLWGVQPDQIAQSGFDDVDPAAYYSPYIQWAADNGIVKGKGNGTFDADAEVTREQLAVMFGNFLDFADLNLIGEAEGTADFSDSGDISDWSLQSVAKMKQFGIVTGKTGNVFDPAGEATRGEIAAMLERLIQAVVR